MRNPFFPRLIVCAFTVGFFSSCASDKEEDIAPTPNPPQNQQCDTNSVTYSSTVASILSSNCNSCHSTSMASGGVVLDTYTGARAQALNGKLVGTISHSAGFTPMPQGGGKLSDCNIAKIKKWVDAGALNN